MSYEPPFKITSKAINLISQISEKIGEINNLENTEQSVQLRKKNRIRTIHSSLAIENNSLSIEQITAIIEGKRVLGPPNEIQEVKNAVQAYELLLNLNPYNQKDLLKAHQLMMNDLVKHSGKYRKGGVGIFDGKDVVHVAPPADRVPFLMNDLFAWLKNSDAHPLIKSCVFHYEFEFIHPFEDGNGRMGRLWQTVILTAWKPIFAWLPIETLIKENQKLYYKALGISDSNADSTEFIEFMLSIILKTIKEIIATELKITQKITQKITVNQQKIIAAVKNNPYITQEELAEIVGIARLNIIKNMKKLQEQNIIKRIGADKNGYWQILDEKLQKNL
ncbi:MULTISPECIES: Fic family protein [unclassified Treponema]|uniref:Fic family protein n=1 Tax=unclassified Treponema TaxID=2638727 RepID=UPI0020A2E081|nr:MULTISPECIES: Fic family protein [unclassified Treponema]UTC67179.1 Fic family protein [Treponema sp. OMZ 789]UTC69909.1 Fic family protein [Treponema sp. OMZ 790]UTC72624.1 Fic family protein [Treponema sp. OMZ 791]